MEYPITHGVGISPFCFSTGLCGVLDKDYRKLAPLAALSLSVINCLLLKVAHCIFTGSISKGLALALPFDKTKKRHESE